MYTLLIFLFFFFLLFTLIKPRRSISPELGALKPLNPAEKFHKRKLLSEPESLVFRQLNEHLGQTYYICPQIAMGALVEVTNEAVVERMETHGIKSYLHAKNSMRTEFNKKIIDFVMVSKADLSIRFLIELDDSSHLNKKNADARRDTVLEAAGYSCVRVPFRTISDLTPAYVLSCISKQIKL